MNLFGKEDPSVIKELKDEIKRLKTSIEDSYRSKMSFDKEHELKIMELESEYFLGLREKEFELKHFKDEEIKKIREAHTALDKVHAVLRKENELLKEVTDVNSDIIDVKELVTKLIEKMPNIDLKNLTVNASTPNKE